MKRECNQTPCNTGCQGFLIGIVPHAGDKTAGAVQVLYSPSLSERGVLFCAHRKPRQKDPFDFEVPSYLLPTRGLQNLQSS